VLECTDAFGSLHGVHNNRIDMWERILLRDLVHGTDAEGAEADRLQPLRERCLVASRVHEEQRTVLERSQLVDDHLLRRLHDVRREGEVEGRSEPGLRVDPHVALHEVDEALRNRQTETGASVFLSEG
jgi:hypothetical protein